MKQAPVSLIVLILSLGCASTGSVEDFGKKFDDLCIVGRITSESASALNLSQSIWKQHTDYTNLRQPEPVKSSDRIFNGNCSEVIKRLAEGDVEAALQALREVIQP